MNKTHSYQFLLEDHLSEPLEVQWFEGRNNKKGVLFILFGVLDRSLWVGNPQGGFAPYIFAITSDWCFVQPATTIKCLLLTW